MTASSFNEDFFTNNPDLKNYYVWFEITDGRLKFCDIRESPNKTITVTFQ